MQIYKYLAFSKRKDQLLTGMFNSKLGYYGQPFKHHSILHS